MSDSERLGKNVASDELAVQAIQISVRISWKMAIKKQAKEAFPFTTVSSLIFDKLFEICPEAKYILDTVHGRSQALAGIFSILLHENLTKDILKNLGRTHYTLYNVNIKHYICMGLAILYMFRVRLGESWKLNNRKSLIDWYCIVTEGMLKGTSYNVSVKRLREQLDHLDKLASKNEKLSNEMLLELFEEKSSRRKTLSRVSRSTTLNSRTPTISMSPLTSPQSSRENSPTQSRSNKPAVVDTNPLSETMNSGETSGILKLPTPRRRPSQMSAEFRNSLPYLETMADSILAGMRSVEVSIKLRDISYKKEATITEKSVPSSVIQQITEGVGLISPSSDLKIMLRLKDGTEQELLEEPFLLKLLTPAFESLTVVENPNVNFALATLVQRGCVVPAKVSLLSNEPVDNAGVTITQQSNKLVDDLGLQAIIISVKVSWKWAIKPQNEKEKFPFTTICQLVYDKLFGLVPAAKALFPNIESRSQALAGVFSILLYLDMTKTTLKTLGRIHHTLFKINLKLYLCLGLSIMHMFRVRLDKQWKVNNRKSFIDWYSIVCEGMLKGGPDSISAKRIREHLDHLDVLATKNEQLTHEMLNELFREEKRKSIVKKSSKEPQQHQVYTPKTTSSNLIVHPYLDSLAKSILDGMMECFVTIDLNNDITFSCTFIITETTVPAILIKEIFSLETYKPTEDLSVHLNFEKKKVIKLQDDSLIFKTIKSFEGFRSIAIISESQNILDYLQENTSTAVEPAVSKLSATKNSSANKSSNSSNTKQRLSFTATLEKHLSTADLRSGNFDLVHHRSNSLYNASYNLDKAFSTTSVNRFSYDDDDHDEMSFNGTGGGGHPGDRKSSSDYGSVRRASRSSVSLELNDYGTGNKSPPNSPPGSPNVGKKRLRRISSKALSRTINKSMLVSFNTKPEELVFVEYVVSIRCLKGDFERTLSLPNFSSSGEIFKAALKGLQLIDNHQKMFLYIGDVDTLSNQLRYHRTRPGELIARECNLRIIEQAIMQKGKLKICMRYDMKRSTQKHTARSFVINISSFFGNIRDQSKTFVMPIEATMNDLIIKLVNSDNYEVIHYKTEGQRSRLDRTQSIIDYYKHLPDAELHLEKVRSQGSPMENDVMNTVKLNEASRRSSVSGNQNNINILSSLFLVSPNTSNFSLNTTYASSSNVSLSSDDNYFKRASNGSGSTSDCISSPDLSRPSSPDLSRTTSPISSSDLSSSSLASLTIVEDKEYSESDENNNHNNDQRIAITNIEKET